MIKKWELLKSEKVFDSPFISLFREDLKRQDGKVIKDFYAVKRRDAVYIVALTEDKKVPLVYQYKNGVKDLILELPAGFIEEGETALESGKRELLEETGFEMREPVEIGNFIPNPSISANRNYVLFGQKARNVAEQRLDSNEEIEVKLMDFEELVEKIKSRQSPLLGSQDQLSLLLAWEYLKK